MMKMKVKLFLRLKVITAVYNVICYYCLCVITASRATRTKKKSTNDDDEEEDVSKTKSIYSTL